MFSSIKGQLLFPFSMRQPIIVKVCRKLIYNVSLFFLQVEKWDGQIENGSFPGKI